MTHDDLPRRPPRRPKKLSQVWEDEQLTNVLLRDGVAIPDLLRRALREAAEKIEPGICERLGLSPDGRVD